nr:MAG TPA: PsbP [Caudoviricetes sp.]
MSFAKMTMYTAERQRVICGYPIGWQAVKNA